MAVIGGRWRDRTCEPPRVRHSARRGKQHRVLGRAGLGRRCQGDGVTLVFDMSRLARLSLQFDSLAFSRSGPDGQPFESSQLANELGLEHDIREVVGGGEGSLPLHNAGHLD